MSFPSKRLALRASVCAALPVMAASFLSLAHAEELLAPITVTATRMPSSYVLAPISIITRDEIERLQIKDLPQLLSRQVGVDLTANGGIGKSSNLYLRGTNSGHVLVLVDGVKWYSATLGNTSFQDFPIEQIERIEIVRGPRSGLYGSEAIGGVIQIFTRKGQDGARPYAKVGYGTHNSKEASAGVSGGNEQTRYHVGISHQSTDGINSRVGVNPDSDGYRNNSITAKVSHQFNDKVDVGLHFLRSDAETETDPFSSLTETNRTDIVQQVLGSHLGLQLTDQWQMSFDLGESRDQFGATDIDGSWVDFTRINTRHRSFSWLNGFDLSPEHRLLVGFDYAKDDINSTNDYAETSRFNRAVFASWQADVDQHSWMLSARHDDNQSFGSENTGNAEYGYQLQNGLLLTATAGTAFKAPTFNDLYWPASSYSAGNPDLLPEKSKSFSLGISQNTQWVNWSVSAYHTKIRNLIDWQEVSPYFWAPTNVEEARIRGLELDIQSQISYWDIAFNASLLQPEDVQTGKQLSRRAKQLANVMIDRQWGPLSAGASWKLRSKSFDDAANTTRLGGYGLLDLRVGYQLQKAWLLQANLSNVFDKDYQTVNNYNSLDRTVMLTLSYQP